MFYSKDLLGKKSPLGAIWIAAHGKKLKKGQVLQVNIGESCKHIMDPEVPQALRLQAILVGGVVIIYNKQQGFLLEDCTEMLKRMRAMSEPIGQGPTLKKEKNKAKVEAITMPAADMLAEFNAEDLFPTFSAQLGGPEASLGGNVPQVSDDLFVMPTFEGGDTPKRSGSRGGPSLLAPEDGDARGLALEGLERFDLNMMDQPETFEVPDINVDMPGMEMFQLQPPSPGAMPIPEGEEPDLFPVPHEPLAAADEEQPLRSQTPQPSVGKVTESGGAAPRTQKRKKKQGKKRPIVDATEEVQIRSSEYREWTRDYRDLLMPRPQQRAGQALHKTPLLSRPATTGLLGGAWPAELMELFSRNATSGATPSKPKAAAKGAAEAADKDVAAEEEQQERQQDDFQLQEQQLGEYGAGLDYGDMPLPGEGWLDAKMEAQALNPFRQRSVGSGGRTVSEGTEDIETERLRAVLNNTPGSALEPFYLNQADLTPAENGLASNQLTGRSKRNRSALRPDSEKALSERSSDPRAAGRLSVLGDLEGDMAAMLPVVDEHEEYLGETAEGAVGTTSRKRQRMGAGAGEGEVGPSHGNGSVSQFELLEESGPGTQAVGASQNINPSTLALIGLLRGKFNALEAQDGGGPCEVSLNDMAAKLSRRDAARLFAQILVTTGNSFTKAKQEEPYGDIILSRGPIL